MPTKSGHVFEGIQECRLVVVLPLARPPPPSVPPLQNFLSPSSCKPLHPSTFTLPAPTSLSFPLSLSSFPSSKVESTKERERDREKRQEPLWIFFPYREFTPCRSSPRHPLSGSVHDVLRVRATPGEGSKKNSTPNL